jgi:hypothetical protein
MSTKIELSKTRDFGEIISDSFLFIRENFMPLLKCFLIFCGFFLLASLVLTCLQQAKLIGLMNNTDPNSYSSNGDPFQRLSKFFGVQYFITIIFHLLSITAITVTILSYMAVYKVKGNLTPTTEEVWGYVKYHFFKTFGSIFLVAVMLIIGTVCCIIPGIYLYPILSLIFPVMVIENTGFGYAIGQSFRLIKQNWWATFGALFVTGLIVYVLTMVIVLPVSVANMGSLFLHRGKGVHLSPTLSIVSAILSTVCHVFYILPLVTLTLCYFSLTEIKDATGLMSRINQLGNNEANTDLPSEEY